MSRPAFFVLLVACLAVWASHSVAQHSPGVNWEGSCYQSATFSGGKYTCAPVPIAAPAFITTYESNGVLQGYTFETLQTVVAGTNGQQYTIPAESSNGTYTVTSVAGKEGCVANNVGDQVFISTTSLTMPDGTEQILLVLLGIADMATGVVTCPTTNSTSLCTATSYPLFCTLTMI